MPFSLRCHGKYTLNWIPVSCSFTMWRSWWKGLHSYLKNLKALRYLTFWTKLDANKTIFSRLEWKRFFATGSRQMNWTLPIRLWSTLLKKGSNHCWKASDIKSRLTTWADLGQENAMLLILVANMAAGNLLLQP